MFYEPKDMLERVRANLPDGATLSLDEERATSYKFTINYDGMDACGEIYRSGVPCREDSIAKFVVCRTLAKGYERNKEFAKSKDWNEKAHAIY